MAGTRSNSIRERESPQYAYALAILSGGIAVIVSQLGATTAAWLSYVLLAALFSSIWPDRAMQWGGWLCLPIILLICFDVIVSGSIGGFLRNGMMFAKALSCACLGAYVGSKLSRRKIANRSAKKQVNRQSLKSNRNGAQNGLILKEPATSAPSAKTIFSSHSSNALVQVTERFAHLHGLNTALIKAAQEGDLKRINLLVAGGADVNAKSNDQLTPLMTAALCDVKIVQTLFDQGTALVASGVKGWTALMIATIEGHVEVVRALLEHGAQVNAGNNKGWTALRFAVSMDDTEILHVLLNAGADANLKDHEGKTALMQAAGENIKESLNALLEAGADPYIRDHNEQTALRIAQKQGYTEIVKLLKEAEAKVFTGIDARVNSLDDDNSKVTDKTHRTIKVPATGMMVR